MSQDEYKIEGHWYSTYEPHFPTPIHSDVIHPLKEQILKAYDNLLARPEFQYGEHNWHDNTYVVAYRGFSSCRCCNFGEYDVDKHGRFDSSTEKSQAYIERALCVNLGNKEYRYNGWKWPEGYRHYIDIHNVVPSADFLKEVLGIEL